VFLFLVYACVWETTHSQEAPKSFHDGIKAQEAGTYDDVFVAEASYLMPFVTHFVAITMLIPSFYRQVTMARLFGILNVRQERTLVSHLQHTTPLTVS